MSAVSIQNALIPAQSVYPTAVTDIVKKVAIACLKELALSLVLGMAVACFTPMAAGLSLLITTTFVQFAVSAFFHSMGAFASYKIGHGEPSFEKLLSVCEWFTGANFALFTGFNTQKLIHETGHALAAISVFKRPYPQMEIYPFIGGLTQFYKSSYSTFGKKIGPVAATCLVVASGPALTLLISGVILAIGWAIKEKYPQFGKYLITWGLIDFIDHAQYAYSALGAKPSDLSHDFVHLSIFGLNPVVATVSILAMPILITAGMWWWQKGRSCERPMVEQRD